MANRRRFQFSLLALLTLVTGAAILSAYLASLRSPEARLRAALERPTDVNFVDTPLADAIDYLRQLHAIEMQLSYDTVGEDNWDYFHPTVTCSAKGKRLRDVLDEILGPYHLTYILADGVLLIVKDSDPLAKSKR